MYNSKQRLVRVTIFAVGKQSLLYICIKLNKASKNRALALRMLFIIGIQHEMPLRHISFVDRPGLQTASTLKLSGTIFEKSTIKCVF